MINYQSHRKLAYRPSDDMEIIKDNPVIHISERGFSLMELIVVIIILAVLSVVAIPRLNISDFEETGFLQQSLAAIRYSQKLAISSGCSVQVTINATQCLLSWNDCDGMVPTDPIPNPATGNNNFCAEGDSSTVTGGTVIFDRIGRPDTSATFTIGTRQIRVEAETGYAHEI